MDELLAQMRAEIPRAFESDFYTQRQSELSRSLQEEQTAELVRLESYAGERGFALLKTEMGLVIAPVLKDKVLEPEQYDKLPPEIRQRFESHRPDLQEALEKATRKARDAEKSAKEKVKKLDVDVTEFALGHLIQDLEKVFADLPEVLEYLNLVRKDVVENVDRFRVTESPSPQTPAGENNPEDASWFNRYLVNVIVDNGQSTGAPVVVESNPTYYNLVGSIEHQAIYGVWVTDFTMIKDGALHRANGGYLVIDAKRLLLYPYAWDALKRAMRTQCIRIEEMAQESRAVVSATLEPQPIPLQVKVVIIGDPDTYYTLYAWDEEFRKLFKVRADFEAYIPWSDENLQKYAFFVAARCREEHLVPFDPSGVAAVVEHSAREVEDQSKLSTRFADIADLVREASYWARREGHKTATEQDVCRAIQERTYRSNRVEEQMRQFTEEGMIRVDTEGELIGQVNGLAVINMGDYAFGRPSRITAKTYWGRAGVLNIDREVKLTESSHDKGLLILTSYLHSRYAQERPLSLSASLVFEQGYDGVAGDSASSTELYALLSSIGQIPIKQSIAVTGSVDQHGEVQPVGGVTYKIEGFFDLCRARGLSGEQGVMIPARNVSRLMLKQEVIDAVREGKFHIYAVNTIDEGLTVLTGLEAGRLDEEGAYPEGTANYEIVGHLIAWAERVENYGKETEEEEAKEKEEEAENPTDEASPTDPDAEP